MDRVESIIEQIKALPPGELAKVIQYVREQTAASTEPKPRFMDSETFKKAADKVFTENAELFRKLAE